MTEKRSSYMWRTIGAAGRNHFICIQATRELGQVWRTLSPRGGYMWMGEATTTGNVVTAFKREEVAHQLRKLEVQA